MGSLFFHSRKDKVLKLAVLLLTFLVWAPDLRSQKPSATLPVIIYLSTLPVRQNPELSLKESRRNLILELKENANRSQPSILSWLHRRGIGTQALWINNSIACNLTLDEISEIKTWPEVRAVYADEIVVQSTPTTAALGAPRWNLNSIEVPPVWLTGQQGQKIIVASMDSGVDGQQASIASQFRGGSNSWFDPFGQHPKVPFDSSGHGTQVMSLILGGSLLVNNQNTAIGTAPAAKWIAVKIFNDLGVSTYSAIHAGFQWLLDPDKNPATDDAPHVVNMSWGLSSRPQVCDFEFLPDLSALAAAKISIVAASGNGGPLGNTSISPGNYPKTLSVGSVDQSLIVSSFSGRGPSACDGSIFPKLVAPGENLLAADRTSGGVFKNATTFVSGTSFATAHISGAIAILRGAFPLASVADINQALEKTALDLGAFGPDNSYGQGLIQVNAAYSRLALSFAPTDPTLACKADADLDGAVDCHDGCPADRNKIGVGVCGCGVSDTDSDKDGTPDCFDTCPNDPNHVSGACNATPSSSSPPSPTGGSNAGSTVASGGCTQNLNGEFSGFTLLVGLFLLSMRLKRSRRIR